MRDTYGWVNRTLDDGDLDSFVDTLVGRLASFDRETLFFPLLALPGAQARRAKVRNIGYGLRSDFELNFGRYLRSGGRTIMTRICRPTDRPPGFLNSAPTLVYDLFHSRPHRHVSEEIRYMNAIRVFPTPGVTGCGEREAPPRSHCSVTFKKRLQTIRRRKDGQRLTCYRYMN
jgi:hypothetical protein